MDKVFMTQESNVTMKPDRCFSIKTFFVRAFFSSLGLTLIIVGSYLIAYFIRQSIWDIRMFLRSSYPISAFSSPAVLLGISLLMFAIFIGWVLTFGRGIWKAIKNKSNWTAIILNTGLSFASLSFLLIGIYFLCVKGYHWYLDYEIAKALATSEKHFLTTRDMIIHFAKRDIIDGILYALLGGINWLLWFGSVKRMSLPDSNQVKVD